MEAVTLPGVHSRSGRIVLKDSPGGPNTHRLAPYARPASPIRHMRKYSGFSLIDSASSAALIGWSRTPGCGISLACSRRPTGERRGGGLPWLHVTDLYGYEMRAAASCDVGPDTPSLPPPLHTDYCPGRVEHVAGPMYALEGYYPSAATLAEEGKIRRETSQALDSLASLQRGILAAGSDAKVPPSLVLALAAPRLPSSGAILTSTRVGLGGFIRMAPGGVVSSGLPGPALSLPSLPFVPLLPNPPALDPPAVYSGEGFDNSLPAGSDAGETDLDGFHDCMGWDEDYDEGGLEESLSVPPLDRLQSTTSSVASTSRREKEFSTVIRILLQFGLLTPDKATALSCPDSEAPDFPDASLFVEPAPIDPSALLPLPAEPTFHTVSGVRFDFSDRQQRLLAERYARSVVSKTLEGHERYWAPWLKFIEEQRGEPNYPGPRLELIPPDSCPSVDHARALWVSLYMVWLPEGGGVDASKVPRHVTALRAFFWSRFPFYDDFFDLAVARRGKKGKGPMTAEQITEALTSKDRAFKDCVPVEYHALAKQMCWDRRDWASLPSAKLAVAYFCTTVLRETGGRVGNVSQTSNLSHILYPRDFVFRVPSHPLDPLPSSTLLLKGGNAIREYLLVNPLSSVLDVTFKNLSTKAINTVESTATGGVARCPEFIMGRETRDSSSTLDIWLEVFRETNIQTDDMLGVLYHQSPACRTGEGSTMVTLPDGQRWQPYKTTQGNVNSLIKTVCSSLGLDPDDYSSKSVGRIFVFTNRRALNLTDAEALQFCGFAPNSVVPFKHYDKLAPKPSTSTRTDLSAAGGGLGFVNLSEVQNRAASRKRSLGTSSTPLNPSSADIIHISSDESGDSDAGEGGFGTDDANEGAAPEVATGKGKRKKVPRSAGFAYAPPLDSLKSKKARDSEPSDVRHDVPFLPSFGYRVVPAGKDKRNPLLPYVPRSFFEVAPSSAKNEWPNPLPIGESLWALPGCTSSPGQAIGEFVFDLPYVPLADVANGKVDGTYCIRVSSTHCVNTRSAFQRGDDWLSACNNLSGLVDPLNGNKKYASHDNKLALSFDYDSRPGQVVLRLYSPTSLRNITVRTELGWPYGHQNMPAWRHLCSLPELALWDAKPAGRTHGLTSPAGFYDIPGNAFVPARDP